MLRLHLTGKDLGRVRMATSADPLWEAMLSLHQLRARDGAPVFDEWRRRTRAVLATGGLARRVSSLLLPLNPRAGTFPDFLTPAESADGLEAGLAAVATTPRQFLHSELERVTCGGTPPAWAAKLAEGDPGTIADLARTLRAYHQTAIAPYWAYIQRRVDAERAARIRPMLDGGVERLLASLWPMVRWKPPILECDHPLDQDVHLLRFS